MQTELLTRDYQKPPPLRERLKAYIKSWFAKNKNFAQWVKNPKVLTILALSLTFVVLILAVMVITANRGSAVDTTPLNQAIITQPATPTPSTQQTELEIEIQNFFKSLGDSQPFSEKLKQPIVDLDLNFN